MLKTPFILAGFVLLAIAGVWSTDLGLEAEQSTKESGKSSTPPGPKRDAGSQGAKPAPEFRSAKEIERHFDRLKIQALADYVSSGDRSDAEQANMMLFNAVIEHDLFADFEKVADRYLKEQSAGGLTPLARSIKAMALASRSDFAQAGRTYGDMLAEINTQNVAFAWNFGGTLARQAQAAGDYQSARKILSAIAQKFPDEAEIKAQVDSQLARLELVGKPAPAFEAVDLDGKSVALKEYRNKVTLLDFWATWCRPCVAELPNVQAVYNKFRGRGFDVVGISLDDDAEAVREFVKDRKLPWRQIVNRTEKDKDIVALYGVEQIPSTFLLDGSGKIQRIDLRGDNLEKAVESLLPKSAAKP